MEWKLKWICIIQHIGKNSQWKLQFNFSPYLFCFVSSHWCIQRKMIISGWILLRTFHSDFTGKILFPIPDFNICSARISGIFCVYFNLLKRVGWIVMQQIKFWLARNLRRSEINLWKLGHLFFYFKILLILL